MTVKVTHIYGGAVETFTGEPSQVQRQLRLKFDFLASKPSESVMQDIAYLGRQQAYIVEVSE